MDIKAFLGVNIVQEGLEKFIKEKWNLQETVSSLKASNLKAHKLKHLTLRLPRLEVDVLWLVARLCMMFLGGWCWDFLCWQGGLGFKS
jgi:hypothetical protein